MYYINDLTIVCTRTANPLRGFPAGETHVRRPGNPHACPGSHNELVHGEYERLGMTREQKFFNALRDVFVGAKVEGESGYINLMRIKSRYYETGVFLKLQQDINEALKQFPAFRDELFEKLYDFFHRYFSESGSIYFRYTPLHQNVYEKVYTDNKDVMLFWKTHMLYYVKTDRLFKSLDG